MKRKPLTLECFKIWDDANENHQDLVIVATEHYLLWYQLKNEVLELIWEITLHSHVLSTMQFIINDRNVLLLTTIDGQARFYQFEIPSKQFWMIQMIQLEVPSSSISLIENKREDMVAFVQNSTVAIYKYKDSHFSLYRTIGAGNVTTISAFRIGGHSYLAVGGDEPKILRLLNGEFIPQTILSQTFGFVEAYLPILARTYRDDLILLVQHRLHSSTHSFPVLEALIWNGLAFDTASTVTCHVGDVLEPLDGLICVLDYEREEGLSGATFIKNGKNISLIVPRHEAESGLFKVIFLQNFNSFFLILLLFKVKLQNRSN